MTTPLAVTMVEVAEMLSISRQTVSRLVRLGKLETIDLGGLRSTRITTASIRRLHPDLDAQLAGGTPTKRALAELESVADGLETVTS